jgi:FkbM family methyltransferase
MKTFLKNLARRAARLRGYAIAKYPTVAFKPLPVFDLAVELLQRLKGPTLTFVQVGANDGVMGDPIAKFVWRYPWRGILIEPQPDVFARLKANYAAAADRLIFENLAIAPSAGELTLYRPPEEVMAGRPWVSGSVSADPAVAEAEFRLPRRALDRLTVPCMPLDAVLAQHGWREIDILTIDTEGKDCEVLLTLDLAKAAPTIVQFEHGHMTPRDIDRAVGHLAAHGYDVLYGGYQTDTLAVRAGVLSP